MTSKLDNINSLISKNPYKGIKFTILRVIFEATPSSNLELLENVLKADDIKFVKRKLFFKRKIIADIAITSDFNEAEYQMLIGKLFILSSFTYAKLGSVGLIG